MSNDHDNEKLGPDDIARIATEQLALRRAAQSTFDDMGKVQRLAANRPPIELRDDALACIFALMAHHTVNIRILESNLTDAAGEVVDSEELKDTLATIETFTSDRERLFMASETLQSVCCHYPSPDPEDMEEFFFSDFHEPAAEEVSE